VHKSFQKVEKRDSFTVVQCKKVEVRAICVTHRKLTTRKVAPRAVATMVTGHCTAEMGMMFRIAAGMRRERE
jgi:hypothetical protein